MRRRIYFKEYDSTGKFPDGRIKLDIYFKDSEKNLYIWTPRWEKVRALFLEGYRIEKLNRLKGKEIEEYKETGKEVLFEEEIESYDVLYGYLERVEKGQVVIDCYEVQTGWTKHKGEKKIPISIEFRTKVMEETKNLLLWVQRNKSRFGNWIIVNGELFDVKWGE